MLGLTVIACFDYYLAQKHKPVFCPFIKSLGPLLVCPVTQYTKYATLDVLCFASA